MSQPEILLSGHRMHLDILCFPQTNYYFPVVVYSLEQCVNLQFENAGRLLNNISWFSFQESREGFRVPVKNFSRIPPPPLPARAGH